MTALKKLQLHSRFRNVFSDTIEKAAVWTPLLDLLDPYLDYVQTETMVI